LTRHKGRVTPEGIKLIADKYAAEQRTKAAPKDRDYFSKRFKEYRDSIQKGMDRDDIVVAAYEDGLPEAYISALRTTPTMTPKQEADEKHKTAMEKLREKALAYQGQGVDIREAMLALAQGNYALAQQRLDLSVQQFEHKKVQDSKKDDGTGGNIPQRAKEFALSTPEVTLAKKYGISKSAYEREPINVRALFEDAKSDNPKYWQVDSKNGGAEYISGLNDAGKARIKELNGRYLGVTGPLPPARPGMSADLKTRRAKFMGGNKGKTQQQINKLKSGTNQPKANPFAQAMKG
jgi:hypothetical protein